MTAFPPVQGKGSSSLPSSFYKNTNPIMCAPPSWPQIIQLLLKGSTSEYCYFRVRVSTCEGGRWGAWRRVGTPPPAHMSPWLENVHMSFIHMGFYILKVGMPSSLCRVPATPDCPAPCSVLLRMWSTKCLYIPELLTLDLNYLIFQNVLRFLY